MRHAILLASTLCVALAGRDAAAQVPDAEVKIVEVRITPVGGSVSDGHKAGTEACWHFRYLLGSLLWTHERLDVSGAMIASETTGTTIGVIGMVAVADHEVTTNGTSRVTVEWASEHSPDVALARDARVGVKASVSTMTVAAGIAYAGSAVRAEIGPVSDTKSRAIETHDDYAWAAWAGFVESHATDGELLLSLSVPAHEGEEVHVHRGTVSRLVSASTSLQQSLRLALLVGASAKGEASTDIGALIAGPAILGPALGVE